MIVLNVTFHVKPGMRDAYYEELKPFGEYFRKEKGNHCYSYFASCEDPDVLFLLEKWEDRDALRAHSHTEVFASLAPINEKYTTDIQLKRYEE